MANGNGKEKESRWKKKRLNGEKLVERKTDLPSRKERQESTSKARKATAEAQKKREALSEFESALTGEGPHLVLFMSDVHWGTTRTKEADVDEFLKVAQDRDAAILMLGDELEGSKPKHRTIERSRTGSVSDDALDFQTAVIEPNQERIIAAVGEHYGHTGWSDESDISLWLLMYDPYGIAVLKNGARVKIEAGGRVIVTDVAHYWRGGSSIDMLHTQREHAKRKKGKNRPLITASGHTHQAGFAVENYPGQEDPMYLFQSGAFKGQDPEYPDPYASFGAFDSEVGDPGQGFVATKNNIYPGADLDELQEIHAAMDLFENEYPTYQEALAMAKAEDNTSVTFRSKKSHPSIDSEDLPSLEEQEAMMDDEEEAEVPNGIVYSKGDLAPLYDTVSYNIRSDWPMLFLPVANVRLGSSYEGLDQLKQMIEEFVTGNPHVFLAFLGNVIDSEVAGRKDRVEVLDTLIDLVSLVGADKVLAILLDGAMRHKNWRKDVKDLDYVPPGTYVSKATGVPLVPGGSTIQIYHGPSTRAERNFKHEILLLDGLKRHGSYSKATSGLSSYYKNHDNAGHDVLVSGAHPHSGISTQKIDGRDVDLVDVGWLSPFDNTSGKKNVQRTAEGGQGVIIHKDMRIPTNDWNSTMELFNAMLALVAARKYKMIDW